MPKKYCLKKPVADCKNSKTVKIFNTDYVHLGLKNKDDLYVTKYGLPFIDNLMPDKFWTDKKWFKKNSTRLSGTSCLYKVRTKKIKGKYLDIVLKWNRMGQDIPGSEDSDELMNAAFNSPFEEFSLVMELKEAMDKSDKGIIVQKPLAIYVPSEHVELWKTGRKEYKIQYKIDKHKEVPLDINRLYAVIYEWIPGFDASQACGLNFIDKNAMELLTLDSEEKLNDEGYTVKDRKPSHVILKKQYGKNPATDKNGIVSYGLIDFELLQRTPDKDLIVKKVRRADYHTRQKNRFNLELTGNFPPHLKSVKVMGVDYVYGQAESTKGALWVVGNDPNLFDYFLPERWEKSPRTKISDSSEMYHTVTKDNIHIVWKLSKVGLKPDMDPFKEDERKIVEYGYNSPFEEISIAVELSKKGMATIYPRAIYRTGYKTDISDNLSDNSRYELHKNSLTPDNNPILAPDHDYIIIWGYWNGPDDKLAERDGDYYKAIDALRAYKEKIITQEKYIPLLKMAKDKLLKLGIEDLNLRGNHILLSLDSRGVLITDEQGMPEIRICSFELLKRTK